MKSIEKISIYKLEDYITLRAASDKFNKYYKKDIEENNTWSFEIIQKLFIERKHDLSKGTMISAYKLIKKYKTINEELSIKNLRKKMNLEEFESFQKNLSDIKNILFVSKYKKNKKADDICINYIKYIME